MAGRAVGDESSIARCVSARKHKTSSCLKDLNGFLECHEDKCRCSFNSRLSDFLKEMSPSICLRPIPPLLGNGESVDLVKLFFAIIQKGGCNAVTEKDLWDKVGEDIGLGSGTGPAIRLVYMKYLGLLEREVVKTTEAKSLRGELKSSSDNSDGVIMEFETEIECFLSKNLDHRSKISECDTIAVKGQLKASEVKVEDLNMKVDKSEVSPMAVDDEVIIIDSDAWNHASSRKRKRDCISGMLNWLTSVAKDPTDPSLGSLPECCKWDSYSSLAPWRQVLSARLASFLKKPELSSPDASVNLKHKMHPSMFEEQNGSERLRYSRRLSSTVKPRRSSRFSSLGRARDVAKSAERMKVLPHLQSFTDDYDLPENSVSESENRRRVPIGPGFQVNVPEWTGVDAENDSKWLGTRVWPLSKKLVNSLIERDPIGKGRLVNCGCELPDSVQCIRFHIELKRRKLKLELGSAFYDWKFDKMGEEVKDFWTKDEEKNFKAAVKESSQTQKKTCLWGQMSKHVPTKTWEEQLSYYFNVFLLERRGFQNRDLFSNIDSDDDITELGLAADGLNGERLKSL